jgi:hypothetical protein
VEKGRKGMEQVEREGVRLVDRRREHQRVTREREGVEGTQ